MRGNGAPALILVVDDQSANVQVLGQLLEAADYHVMPALNGEQALARAQARKPDLVLLDMLMPQMDGWQVCRQLRELPGLADVPVIFLTAATDRDYVQRAFAEGAVDYVTKPFVPEELLARVKTHVELKRTRDHLQEMLREREDVTSIVAHDLKNPLANILFSAQLLRRHDGKLEGVEEFIKDVTDSAEEALAFIQRYLSRRAQGEALRSFATEALDLAELTDDVVRRQRGLAGARRISFEVESAPAPIWADRMVTCNVLRNLVSNAVLYSPDGQAVSVAVGPSRPGYSRCQVADRGPGISEEDQKKLFQRFVRLTTAKPNDRDLSSGLGLAIAKHDVTLMGGHLWYEPRPGGGSVFSFELPQTAEAPRV